MSTEDRRALLYAVLGFVVLSRWQLARELVMLHAWLDSWAGLGSAEERAGPLTRVVTVQPT